MNWEGPVPNDERLRHARILKGWSQAELAEQVGTSFEMVSRWEWVSRSLSQHVIIPMVLQKHNTIVLQGSRSRPST